MGLWQNLKNKLLGQKDEEIKEYTTGLAKTSEALNKEVLSVIKKHKKINASFFEELEEAMIMADIGVNTVMDLIDRLQKRVKSENISDINELKEIIIDELFIIYVNDEIIVNKINENPEGPTVVLFVGVNGVGKTTSIGKVAYQLLNQNKKILLVAGDTFRAGATEQLSIWAERLGVDIFQKSDTTDPSSVIYDALFKAKSEEYDYVLIDTAGRLQNKEYLMQELAKINRIIDKVIKGAPHEVLLVIDATTGQNGINQAKVFKSITNVTGIILTKLDGTAKGGIIIAIREAVNIPVKYIGLGEQAKDLHIFDLEKYIYSLFKDLGE